MAGDKQSEGAKRELTWEAINYTLNKWELRTLHGALKPVLVFAVSSRGPTLNGVEPYDYLHQVLKRIVAADAVEKLEALLLGT